MTERQEERIKREVKAVCDMMESQWNHLNLNYLKHYADSPDGTMFNVDGSQWDFQTFRKMTTSYARFGGRL